MPLYDYRCPSCGESITVLVRHPVQNGTGGTGVPACVACGTQMKRAVSSFAYRRSEQTRLEEAGDPDRPGPGYYKDPGNIGRWTEKRFREMGMDLPGELKEKIAASRDGVLPGPLQDLSQ